MFFGAKGDLIDAPENDAPERAGYDAIQEIFTQPFKLGAERVEMQPTEGARRCKYWVDGVSYEGPASTATTRPAPSCCSRARCGLDISDRRKPQIGNMKATLDGRKIEMQVLTAGSTAGESFVAEINPKQRHEHRLHEMGFTDDQYQVLEDVIGDGTGVVLLATPQGAGADEPAVRRAAAPRRVPLAHPDDRARPADRHGGHHAERAAARRRRRRGGQARRAGSPARSPTSS